MNFSIRNIEPGDDARVAQIIRTVMPEFGATGEGFAINDPEVDWMSRAYSEPRCSYVVIEKDGEVLGGAGVAPLIDGDTDVCELRKMYFLPEVRGLGAGAAMMQMCMDAAMKLYERSGFQRLPGPMGATGHGGCNAFYLLHL